MQTRRTFRGAAALGLLGGTVPHVAYRGSAPGIQDLLGGQIASFLGPVGHVLAYSKAGKVRVLGSFSLAALLKADAAEWSGLAKQTRFSADS